MSTPRALAKRQHSVLRARLLGVLGWAVLRGTTRPLDLAGQARWLRREVLALEWGATVPLSLHADAVVCLEAALARTAARVRRDSWRAGTVESVERLRADLLGRV